MKTHNEKQGLIIRCEENRTQLTFVSKLRKALQAFYVAHVFFGRAGNEGHKVLTVFRDHVQGIGKNTLETRNHQAKVKENFSYYPKYVDVFLTLLQTLAAITRSTSYFDLLVTLLSEPCDYIGPAWISRIISHLMILVLISPVVSFTT